jgi:hypothetical protein
VILSPGTAALALLDSAIQARLRPEFALKTFQKALSPAVAFQGLRGEAEELVEWTTSFLEGFV